MDLIVYSKMLRPVAIVDLLRLVDAIRSFMKCRTTFLSIQANARPQHVTRTEPKGATSLEIFPCLCKKSAGHVSEATMANYGIGAAKAEDFVGDLYRGILMREADAVGAQKYTGILNSSRTFENAAEIMKAFIGSAERAHLEQSIRDSRSLRLSAVGGYAEVISVGSHCVTAGSLKRFGLKKSSYPFDWIFSSIPMVTDCLRDDFAKFLDRKYHRFVPVEFREVKTANHCDHTYYKDNFGVKYVFNHRDITSNEDFEYYKRCVDRMRHVLSSNKKVLFLALVKGVCSVEDFEDLSCVLDAYPHVDLKVVNVIDSDDLSLSINITSSRGGDALYMFRSLRGTGATYMDNDVDEMLLREFLKRI